MQRGTSFPRGTWGTGGRVEADLLEAARSPSTRLEQGRRKRPSPALPQAAQGKRPPPRPEEGGRPPRQLRGWGASPAPLDLGPGRGRAGGAGRAQATPPASRPPRGRHPRPALQVAAAAEAAAARGPGRGRSRAPAPRPAARDDVTIAAGSGVPGSASGADPSGQRAPESWTSPGPSSTTPTAAPGPPAGASARAAAPRGWGCWEWLCPLRLLCRARPFTCGGRRRARSAHGAWRRRRRPARAAGSRQAPRGPPPSPASAYPWTRTTSSRAPCASSRSCGRIGSPSKFGPR